MSLITRDQCSSALAQYKDEWTLDHLFNVSSILKKLRPKLNLVLDGNRTLNDSAANSITISLQMAVTAFKVQSVERLNLAVKYLDGHEVQHSLSTVTYWYTRACENILQYIAEEISLKVSGKKKFFASDRAIISYFEFLRDEKGIIVVMNEVCEACRLIVNCCEDGRIELIRSINNAEFEQVKRIFLFAWYDSSPCRITREQAEEPAEKASVILNQVMFLAKTQMYQKGFLEEFAGTDIHEFVKSLVPDIFRAVTAKTTEKMCEYASKVGKAVAPFVAEAYVLDAEMMKQMMKILKDVLQQMLSEKEQVNGCSEKMEQQGTGEGRPALGMSDVKMSDAALDEETKDMMKQMGVQEEKKQKENSGDGSGTDSSESTDEDQNSSDSQENSGKESAEESETDGKEYGDKDAASENQDKESSKAENEEKNDGNGSSEGEQNSTPGKDLMASPADQSDGKNTSGKGGSKAEDSGGNSGKSRKGSQKSKEDMSGNGMSLQEAIDGLRKEMEEAAKKLDRESRKELNVFKKSEAFEKQQKRAPRKSSSNPLTSADVADICKRKFVEVPRQFELKHKLPVEHQVTADTMREANIRYFEQMYSDDIRFQQTGSMDSSMITELVMGNPEVFSQDGEKVPFKGRIYILVDGSGSMCGEKFEYALTATAKAEESFEIPNIDMKIVVFSYTGDSVRHNVVRNWGELPEQNCSWNYLQSNRAGGGNCDEHDIRIATKELLNNSEEGDRMLLIVLSDGSPDDCEDTKRAIEEARANNIEVIGIYFELGEVTESSARFFTDMYQYGYVLCSADQIDEKLSEELEDWAHRD